MTVGDRGAREYLERVLSERAAHNSAEAVQTTVSFARAERLLGREYHGRFLVELLQNASDAWRKSGRTGRSRVAITIAEGPTLIVANQGISFPARVVVESLGHIGRSTKPRGEAIGHKGIGFKSVLELSATPELYSGLQAPTPEVAVRFDPVDALSRIRRASPEWTRHTADIEGLDSDPHGAVPILRFPLWVDELPPRVVEMASAGFDTAIVLPFRGVAARLGSDEDAWLKSVHAAVDGLTDQILVLLGTFDEVRFEDQLTGVTKTIHPHWAPAVPILEGTREAVDVHRDGTLTSSWYLYRRSIAEPHDLSGEIAVGLRLDRSAGSAAVVAAVEGEPSAPFHLFFPTRIHSGLPLLLHGYFEVNASRTGFYEGSAVSNDAILASLAELVAASVEDATQIPGLSLTGLVDVLARCPAPEDPHARVFKDMALRQLDSICWVPIVADRDQRRFRHLPGVLLDDRPDVVRALGATFSASYLAATTTLALPDSAISDEGVAFLASRRTDPPSRWEVVNQALRPGDLRPWSAGAEEEGFRSLLELVALLQSIDRSAMDRVLEGLRGSPESKLLPVAASDGVAFLPVPDPGAARAGHRGRLVMARVRGNTESNLVPPESLDVAFLPDGLLRSESEIDRAKPLGVRPFTVDNVLDRLNAEPGSRPDQEQLVQFLWRLLARERRSEFGTRTAARRAEAFDPSSWFWLQPGRAAQSETERSRQLREHYLARVMLPSRAGPWRSAGELSFGSDWADWLESGAAGTVTAAISARVDAYRLLDRVLSADELMVAGPEELTPLLAEGFVPGAVQPGDHDEEDDEEDDEELEVLDGARTNAERHAFLLRLGVWEILPVDGYETRQLRGRPFPWESRYQKVQDEAVEARGGWRFDPRWGGPSHRNVFVAEDFRFPWDLAAAADRDATSLSHALNVGVPLYRKLEHLAVICTGCRAVGASHTVPYANAPYDRYPSALATQLQREAWVPAIQNGVPLDKPVSARQVWWSPNPSAGPGQQQNPLRLIPISAPNARVKNELRELAGIPSVESADVAAVGRLLHQLRESAPDVVGGGATGPRQLFRGLHRLLYERLAELMLIDGLKARKAIEEVGVLCDVGVGIDFREVPEARHDDGRFAAHRHLFAGLVPFAVIPRERAVVAQRLGIRTFTVTVNRRDAGTGTDVTEFFDEVIGQRVPELLAIMVYHSLGTQTLELGSEQFKLRSERLTSLRILQVPQLVLDVTVDGTDVKATIGEGPEEDLFLEGATTSQPRIVHDLSGEGWQERFRRRMPPLLAAMLENPAYAATFSLFLQKEGDGEREASLQELGISTADVDDIRSRLGALSDHDRARERLWFEAVLQVLGAPTRSLVAAKSVHDALVAAGLSHVHADRLVEIGGGDASRRDDGPDSAVSLLHSQGVDLSQLHAGLVARDPDDGLVIRVAHRRLRAWLSQHGRKIAAVLARRESPERAKARVDDWVPDAGVIFDLDPAPDDMIAPVVRALREVGYEPDVRRLVLLPTEELERITGLSASELDATVENLFNQEEQSRLRRAVAASWRRELAVLGVLARLGPSDARAGIRAHRDAVEQLLPPAPVSPSSLRDVLGELFPAHREFAGAISPLLGDTLAHGHPDKDLLWAMAADAGIPVARFEAVQLALRTAGGDVAKQVRDRIRMLKKRGLTIQVPTTVKVTPHGATQTKPSGPLRVGQLRVDSSLDQRKRRLGDEGERVALAAVIAPFLEMSTNERRSALAEVGTFLDNFVGTAVDELRLHIEPASAAGIDEDELIEELRALLRLSDNPSFGFDLLGWLPAAPGEPPAAIALEVKSSADGTFHLSTHEWSVADRLRARYGVLVALRRQGGSPVRLDLLTDPCALVESGILTQDPDGYLLRYRATQT